MGKEFKDFIIRSIYEKKGFQEYIKSLDSASKVSKKAKTSVDLLNESHTRTSRKSKKGAKQIQKDSKTIGDAFSKVTESTKIVNGTVVETTKRVTKNYMAMAKAAERVKRAEEKKAKTLAKTQASAKKGISIWASYRKQLTKLALRAPLVIGVWGALRGALMSLNRLVKESIKFMVDWEFQLAQIRLVGSTSEAQINSLSNSLLHLSTSLGISNAVLGESAKLYIQQGRAIEEIVPLMEATAKLSLLTGRSVVQSVEDITAVLSAYKLEAQDASAVVDTISSVMLNHAITAGDLAGAYKATASTAEALGVSLASLSGFVTAIKTVTRDTGTKVGTALRTMFSRISTSSAESLQELTKVPFFLDEMGRVTDKVTPKMRNMSTIISEIALVFGTLENAQQSQIAKLIGGIRRQNQVFALFNNFTEAVEAQTDALLGLGKADEAVATLTETTKLRIESLKGAWGEWVDAVGDTGVFKESLDFIKTQLLGAIAVLDPARAFAIAFGEELRGQADAFVREGKLVEGVEEIKKELLEMQEIASRTTNKFQLDELAQRTRIFAKALSETFAERDIDIKINPTLEDPAELGRILEQASGKLFDLKIDAQVNFDTRTLQSQVTELSANLRNIIESESSKISPTLKLAKSIGFTDKDSKLFEKTRLILDKLAEGVLVTKKEFETLEKVGAKVFDNDKLKGYTNLLEKLDSISKDIVDVDQRRIDKAKELNAVAENHKQTQIIEAQIKAKLNTFDREAIATNLSRLDIVKGRLAILEREENVRGANQDNEVERLKTEQFRLEVSEKRGKLLSKQRVILNGLKTQGATSLQIAIQELAYLEETNAKEDEKLKKREQIAKLRQDVELSATESLIKTELAIFKLQGASGSQIIRQTIELQKKLGIEKKGLEALKQRLALFIAIKKEQSIPKEEKLSKLQAEIVKERKAQNIDYQKGLDKKEESLTRQAEKLGIDVESFLTPSSKIDDSDLISELQQGISDPLNTSIFNLADTIKELRLSILGETGKSTTSTELLKAKQTIPSVLTVTPDQLKARESVSTSPKFLGAPQQPSIIIKTGDTNITVTGTNEEIQKQIEALPKQITEKIATDILDKTKKIGKNVGTRINGD